MSSYARADENLGTFSLRPLSLEADVELLHSWVTHPKAAYWMMLDSSVDDVATEYRRIADDPHHDAFLGFRDGTPAFLAERYDPRFVELPGLFDAADGDVGMHFLCAPASQPLHGFTLGVITTVMAWLFDDPAVRRVVVEPDVGNTAVHALNAAVGFEVVREIQKPEKKALLSTCTREQFLTRIGAAA
ncbi:GNAT family N-acetyltransferase [Actinoplanes sp. NPDC051470]|uniref:GNAT family N-acetyltransferase n=1 Tax=Actinoplanes sp. NPDC051470 TaxID=3157224 RepID=UPI0034348CDD